VRYPVLWERSVRRAGAKPEWAWPDGRLERLRELGVRLIVGLVHHGSGPPGTSLLDPRFPHLLADFAQAVATRYPWLDAYTPVNEPLTTARFSALYGHWYPHGRDDLSFATALLAQCRAVVLSMQAVRSVNSEATLVQTEDLGETKSTPLLNYQAHFENERRWLTYDLLTGRLDLASEVVRWLVDVGISPADIEWFHENPCPPDVVGVNHYLTSDRFLDERLHCHGVWTHGGNGRHRYADVEAVRMREVEGPHIDRLLLKAWKRYGLPVAVTEAHNGSTREEQLRWLVEVWRQGEGARLRGADIVAVTAWAAFGGFDWPSLCTRVDGCYEPGLFDVRSAPPRPTALARVAGELARVGESDDPVLDTPGWWHRIDRFETGPTSAPPPQRRARPILIAGAGGTLGRAFTRISAHRGLATRALVRTELDICDPDAVMSMLDDLQPWAVINAAGYVHVDDAEEEQEICLRANRDGPEILARACARRAMRLVTFSSDLVFDGQSPVPYVESDNGT
jgi:dTDP-4-dehydrorhamnose reductase